MKKLGMIETICFVSLMIAAICFAGCFSSTSPVGTGMSTMPLIGHDEFDLQFYNEEMKIEKMHVVVDIYSDKTLVLDKNMQYLPVGGEGIASLDMNNKIWFSFGLKNTGSAPITITGATINGQGFNYADQSMNKMGPKTINSGKTQKVSWTYPGEVSGKSVRFAIEVKTSGGGETKAQVGTVKPTATQTQASGSVPTASVGPTPTQVVSGFYSALQQGDIEAAQGFLIEKYPEEDLKIISTRLQGVTFEYGDERYKGSNAVFISVKFIDKNGSVHEELVACERDANNMWKKTGIP